jgi:hypothetical protein
MVGMCCRSGRWRIDHAGEYLAQLSEWRTACQRAHRGVLLQGPHHHAMPVTEEQKVITQMAIDVDVPVHIGHARARDRREAQRIRLGVPQVAAGTAGQDLRGAIEKRRGRRRTQAVLGSNGAACATTASLRESALLRHSPPTAAKLSLALFDSD